MNDQRTSDSSPTIVESFPTNGLPAAGAAGRLARVTDGEARLWLDDGSLWSPLVDNTVNVLSCGPVHPTNATTTTATLQAALGTKANVYLPAGVYPIDETLEFHTGQTIFGDGKGRTAIVTDAPITMFRSDTCPRIARDVLFRDLKINNTTWWNSASVGIDFTGVGFSRIERLSMRGHGAAIMGRDSMLRTYVGEKSTDTWLNVTATDNLLYAPGVAVVVRWKDIKGKLVVVKADVDDVATTGDPVYPALALRPKDAATPLPPLHTIPPGSVVFHDDDHGGGYYNAVADCEIADCLRGISLTNDGNNWTVLDGRFGSNLCGIYVESTDGARIRSTFEHNGVGVEFGPGATTNTVLAGSYFEANGQAEAWAKFPGAALGAVRCRLQSNNNTIEPCLLSNSTDYVVDEADDGNNTCSSPYLPAFPAMPSGMGGGGNILANNDFAAWTQPSGLPDGWKANIAVPARTMMSFDPETTIVPAGTTTALRWTMYKGQNTYYSIYREIAVIPGQWYTFTARTCVDDGGHGLYTLTVATKTSFSTEDELYYSHPMPTHDNYNIGMHRHAFRVPDGVRSIYVILRNVNTSKEAEHHYCEVTKDSATARFGKFQLEPGRGVPTESRDSGLMGHVQTGGGLLTIEANKISVTHPFHTVAAGTGTNGGVLMNIVPPPGFSGMIMLRATSSWTAATDGTGPGKIGTALTMTAGKTVAGWYDLGSGTWWFAQS
jgi:hypothetical protein